MGIAQIPLASSGISASDLVTQTEWTQISEYQNTTLVSSISFSSIPQTYKTLRLVINGLQNSSTNSRPFITINNDGNSRYSFFGETENINNNYRINIARANSSFSFTPDNMANGQTFWILDFPGYTQTTAKIMTVRGVIETTVTTEYTTADGVYRNGSSTPAITSLEIITNNGSSSMRTVNDSVSSIILLGGK